MSLMLLAVALLAQQPAATRTPAPAPPARDTTPPPPPPRAGWLSDRLPVRLGAILTVVVDEQVMASDRDNKHANATRSQSGTFDLGLSATVKKPKTFGIGYGSKSDNTGSADRSRDFSAVLSVRVTGVEPGGVLKIEGRRSVAVDGRKEEMILSGYVRAEDVAPDNSLRSSRIADATISYKGKAIGPKSGIFGKILGIFWP